MNNRLLTFLTFLFAFAWTSSNAQMLITGAFDGPLAGGTPKGVELYVTQDIPDLSIYGLGSANNGGGTDGEEFTFPAVAATTGDYIYVASEAVEFANWFGFAPDYTDGSMSINGDDAIELFMNGAVIDLFGDINVDGTNQPWEYLDGWAYRMSTSTASPTFVVGEWNYSGPNALDGETSNATAATPFPVQTYAGASANTDVTLCVDLACFAVADAVAVAGSWDGFNPGSDFLTDTGNGTYCGTVSLAQGNYEYRFFFAQQQFEDLTSPEDDACTANTTGTIYRTLSVGSTPFTQTNGWETCDPTCPVVAGTDITFCVDLSCFPVADAAAVAGSWNGFNPGTDFLTDNGSGTYCKTVNLAPGDYEYKFFFAQQQFEVLTSPEDDACTADTGGGINRTITVAGTPFTQTNGWETCDPTCLPAVTGIPPAPDPTIPAADVISMYSNVYTDVPVDTWLTPWSQAPVTLTDTMLSGNDTKLYRDVTFLGIETVGPNLIDASGMENFHIDFYTENATEFKVKLVDFGADMNFGGGDDTEHEVIFAAPAQNEWVSYTIPFTSFVNLLNRDHIAQLVLSASPGGSADFYIDNVYFSNTSNAMVDAPDPTNDPIDVISMFSNVYTDVPVDTWRTVWSAGDLTDTMIMGNDTKLYTDLAFVGIETVGPNSLDVSTMDTLNIDIFTDNMTTFRVKLVDFGADNAFGGGDDSEHEITVNNPMLNEWVSYSFLLSDFTGLNSFSNISQLILSGEPAGSGRLYVDNVFYSKPPGIADAPDPSEKPTNVISMYSNVYTDVPVDTWLTPWSAAPVSLTDTLINGNDTKLYRDVTFLGIETVGPNLIDASGMQYFNIDFYSENATQFRIKLVDFGADMAFGGGDDTEHEVVYTAPAQNEWISYQIPLTDFINLVNTDNIAQLILSAMPNTVADFYIDNVFFSKDPGPMEPAPDPTTDEALVISMFSNVYTDVPVDTWRTVWSAGNLTDLQIQGNDTKFYSDLSFVGIETVGPNLIDATDMDTFNLDIWIDPCEVLTAFNVKLVDFGADMNFGGGDDSEHEITISNPAVGEWISLKLPLADFTGLAARNNIAQLILSGAPSGGLVYVDNVYYSMAPCDVSFDYEDGETTFCVGSGEIVVTNIMNTGMFSFAGPGNLDIDPISGTINVDGSDPGMYTIYNTVDNSGSPQALTISAVFDGPLTGGTPKGVELYVIEDIADLSIYGIGSANNGGGTDGEEFTFPAVSATAGDYIYVTSSLDMFLSFFGFAAGYETGAMAINGDDAVELFMNGDVVDLYGDINTDGSGQSWDFLDGWAYRNTDDCPSNTFDDANWTFSGINIYDGETTNAGSTPPLPIGTFTTSGCVGGAACMNLDSTMIEILPAPIVSAGPAQSACEGEDVTLAASPAVGTWSGGAGTFSSLTDPNATYTPDATETNTTVVLTWTIDDVDCGMVSSETGVVYIPQEADAGFEYNLDIVCPNGENPMAVATTGKLGFFTVTGGNAATITLDENTGEIDLTTTAEGSYTITNTVAQCGNMIISGVIDGPLVGGVPKAIEFYALADIDDLSIYGMGSANNGGGTDGEEVTFAGRMKAGEYYYVATPGAGFNNFFGFEPDTVSNGASINGDDAIELFCNGVVIDVFGDINTDGTGEAWDHLDGWVYRNDNSNITGSFFDISSWSFSGINALDGETDNASAATPFPIGTFTSSAGNTCPPATFDVDIFIGDTQPLSVSCWDDIEINLGDGLCGEYVNYNQPIVIDNCGGAIEYMLVSGPASGDYLTVDGSPYTVVIEAINVETEDMGMCEFTITINGQRDTIESLTCNTNINISLDGDCEAMINGDVLLEGGGYACYDDYIITIDGVVSTDGIVTEVGTYEVMITDPVSGNSCWGTVNVEDKIAPVVECPCSNPITALTQLTGFANTDFGSPEFMRTGTFNQGGNCTVTAIADHVYDANPIQVSADGNYTFTASWVTPPAVGFSNPSVTIYEAPFDPTQPCVNAIASGIGNETADLLAGVDYVIVFFDFQSNQVGGGDYVVDITTTSNGFVFVGDPACNFLCYEIDAIYNSTVMTPNPVADQGSCNDITSSFSDRLEEVECGTSTITRSWIFTDASGNTTTCNQIFNINNIGISNLTLPPAVVTLGCGADLSPQGVATYYDVDTRRTPILEDDDYTETPDVIENNEGIAFAYPHYMVVGFDGNPHAQPVDTKVCELIATYSDQVLDACAVGCHGNSKVIRDWTLVDWCTTEIQHFTQIIKSVDEDGPTFDLEEQTVSTRPWDCTAEFTLLPPNNLHDACDISPTYYVTGPAGVVISGNATDGYVASGAPKGEHTFTYTAEDCCGNPTSIDVTITVLDQVAPVASSKQDIVIALTPAGPGFESSAKLFTNQVNNFSYDACTDVHIEIRRNAAAPMCGNEGAVINATTGERYNNNVTFNDASPRLHADDDRNDTDGGQFVKFCCEDLTTSTADVDGDGTMDEGYHEVVMRVWDDANMTGVYGDVDANGHSDNYNEIWAYVLVEDNLPPVITCPVDATISCYWAIDLSTDYGAGFQDASQANFDKTGTAVAYSTCTVEDIEFSDRLNLDDCGVGTIRRTWRASKEGKNGPQTSQCIQNITVEAAESVFNVTPPTGQPFSVGECEFDVDNIAANQKPSVEGGICDVIGENVEVAEFLFEDGVCKSWVVTYNYYNWCTGENMGPFDVKYIYEDTEAPTIECADTCYSTDANCEYTLALSKSAIDTSGCTDTGWLKWHVTVDTWADGTPDYVISTYAVNPSNGRNITTWATNDDLAARFGLPTTVQWLYVGPTASGQNFASTALPEDLGGKYSKHIVTYKVTDGCHNFSSCVETIEVADKKAPTPYCLSLSTALMAVPAGGSGMPMVELWACDFNQGSFDNCSPQEDLMYTFDNIPFVVDTVVRAGAVFLPVNVDIGHYFDENGFVDFNGDGGLYPVAKAATLARYNNGEIQKWIPETLCAGKVFTCADAPQTDIVMSVWDKQLNVDFCNVFLTFGGAVGDCQDAPPPPNEGESCDCDGGEFLGWAVATCFGTDELPDVGVIYNISEYESATPGTNWDAAQAIHPASWTKDNIGQVFGTAIDKDQNVYLASSDIYATNPSQVNGYSRAQIFKASAPNFDAQPLVGLPNAGGALNGIGNIVVDNRAMLLYASNLEDGKIYQIDLSGNILDMFDPWTADDGSDGIADQSEQVWGIGLNYEGANTVLYYGRVSNSERSIYSVDVSNGSIGTGSLSISNIPGSRMRISDIAFSSNGEHMIISDRGTSRSVGAHQSRSYRYDLVGNQWQSALQYYVGGDASNDNRPERENGGNSGGGVDFAYSSESGDVQTGCDTDPLALVTGNYMRPRVSGGLLYGIEIIDFNGNLQDDAPNNTGNGYTDIFIDFDGDITSTAAKNQIGDVEVFRCFGSSSNRLALSGSIEMCNDNALANAEVNIYRMGTNEQQSMMSLTDGSYAFDQVVNGMDYMINATVEGPADEGVSTLDLVLIQRHILGIQEFTTPCQILAADVNSSETITGADVVELRKLILGVTNEFDNNDSWKVVKAMDSMEDAYNAVGEIYEYGVSASKGNLDFTAVKVGDVNSSVVESRSANTLNLTFDNETVVSGQQLEVVISSADYLNAYGYQFTLDLDGLELVDVKANDLNMSSQNIAVLNSNTVTVSYGSTVAETATDLFTIVVKANRAGNLSKMINASSEVTRAEAYVGDNMEIVQVALSSRGAAEYDLFQNEPNPFKDQTIIGWNMAEAGVATVTVYDVAGRTLSKVTGEYTKGANTITLNRTDLNGVSGVLYYKLEAGDYTSTKKMILID